jgi:8-oxo-dGTP pyrophosphatase MutT (NUDIX family)
LAVAIQQFGVLAYQFQANGELRLLLITSRDTRRWIVPRGNAITGMLPHESAAQEAWEEAGVTGHIGSDEIGAYPYEKRLGDATFVPAIVHLYPMQVTQQQADWPERGQRETRWFTREEAAATVDEPGLKSIILAFEPPKNSIQA